MSTAASVGDLLLCCNVVVEFALVGDRIVLIHHLLLIGLRVDERLPRLAWLAELLAGLLLVHHGLLLSTWLLLVHHGLLLSTWLLQLVHHGLSGLAGLLHGNWHAHHLLLSWFAVLTCRRLLHRHWHVHHLLTWLAGLLVHHGL